MKACGCTDPQRIVRARRMRSRRSSSSAKAVAFRRDVNDPSSSARTTSAPTEKQTSYGRSRSAADAVRLSNDRERRRQAREPTWRQDRLPRREAKEVGALNLRHLDERSDEPADGRVTV